MDKKMVLFDLDGTLADTLDDIAASMNRVLARRGFAAHPTEDYRRFVGDGVETLAGRTLPAEAKALAPELAGEFRADYKEHLLDATKPYDGVPEMLDELVERGCKMAVVSNKPHAPTLFLVERLFVNWPFVAVYGQSDEWPLKPDPTLCHAVAAAAGVDPQRCLFVGDSNVDMVTGLNAGMHPVGVQWGFRGREELMASGAEAVIAHPRELTSHLETLIRE